MKIDMNTSNKSKKVVGFVTSGTLLNLALGGLVVLGAGSIGLYHFRDIASMAAYPGLDSQDQNASTIIAQDIHQASSVDSGSGDRMVLRVHNLGVVSAVTYTFDPAAHTLTRVDGQGSNILLSDVRVFSFSLFQKPGADAAYNTFAPAVGANAKMVGCRWTCSRKLAGEKVNSGSMEIAPIVLRNRG
jgi:hypothetical protein